MMATRSIKEEKLRKVTAAINGHRFDIQYRNQHELKLKLKEIETNLAIDKAMAQIFGGEE